ncbi:MAG: HlyD family efflux transporter periplasmic adaptor subunit [Polyangiaceae bacterium]
MINNSRAGIWLAFALLGALSGCQAAAGATEEAESFQGTVELEETPIGFELGGRLASVEVREGDVVEAGALLARIDDSVDRSARAARESEALVAKSQAVAVKAGARGEELRSLSARVNAAKASEELYGKQLGRQRNLFDKGAVSAATVDDLQGALSRATAEREALEHTLQLTRQGARREDISVAEARARSAEAVVALDDERLTRHELRAPRKGTVLDVNCDPGEVVAAGAPIVTLADTHRPYVDVFVPQAEISAVSVGKLARLHVDVLAHELTGKVEHIARRTEFTPRYLFSERERPNLVVRVRVRHFWRAGSAHLAAFQQKARLDHAAPPL